MDEAASETLITFLAARLDEDEAAAKAATPGPWAWEATGDKNSSWALGFVQDEDGNDLSGELEHGAGIVIDGVCGSINGHVPDAAHIARNDPARALRETEAKRAVLALHGNGNVPDSCSYCHDAWPCRTVRFLAAVYSDHPDYDQAWRPS
jgi:hypothetical protein